MKYVVADALNFTKAPGPSWDRGGWPWRTTYIAFGLAARLQQSTE